MDGRDPLPHEVFESLPYGVVVVDGGGTPLSWNDAAEHMLPALGTGASRCDQLLACTAPGGPCERGCLVTRAAETGTTLPEIRIDAAHHGGASALWVTTAPLRTESRAVLHLRPGDARDRRRRSVPHWISGPELRIRTFGRVRVDSAEGPLGGRWLQQRAGHLLKYLLCERDRVVHAEEIGEALWPGAGRQGQNNVRHFVHQLRDRLEPGRVPRAPSSFVVAVRGGYALNRRHVRIDADEFAVAATDGLTALERGEEKAGRANLIRAVDLFADDFLADEPYAEWAFEERNRLRGLASRALRALAAIAATEGDLTGAAGRLERLAALEPYDAEVHRDLFAIWLADGRHSEASRGFAAFRMRMRREFGEDPEFELAELTSVMYGPRQRGPRMATLSRR